MGKEIESIDDTVRNNFYNYLKYMKLREMVDSGVNFLKTIFRNEMNKYLDSYNYMQGNGQVVNFMMFNHYKKYAMFKNYKIYEKYIPLKKYAVNKYDFVFAEYKKYLHTESPSKEDQHLLTDKNQLAKLRYELMLFYEPYKGYSTHHNFLSSVTEEEYLPLIF